MKKTLLISFLLFFFLALPMNAKKQSLESEKNTLNEKTKIELSEKRKWNFIARRLIHSEKKLLIRLCASILTYNAVFLFIFFELLSGKPFSDLDTSLTMASITLFTLLIFALDKYLLDKDAEIQMLYDFASKWPKDRDKIPVELHEYFHETHLSIIEFPQKAKGLLILNPSDTIKSFQTLFNEKMKEFKAQNNE